MAVERASKKQSMNLGQLVSDQLDIFSGFRKTYQNKKEIDFSNKILDNNLSAKAQLDFRQQQLEEEQKKTYPDGDYISSIKAKIATLKGTVKNQKIRDAYYSSYNEIKAGRKALTDHLSFLQGQLNDITDPDLREQWQKAINQTQDDILTSEHNIFKNQVTLAQKDGTKKVINEALNKIDIEKGKALLSGQNEWVSSLDLYAKTLQKDLQSAEIKDALHQLDVASLKVASNAYQKLNLINSQIGASADDVPIEVDGTRYNSAKEYWTTQRDKYLSGSGSGLFQNFFGELASNYKSHIDAEAAKNNGTAPPMGVLDTISSEIKSLLSKPEFTPYQQQVNDFYGNTLGYATDLAAKSILDNADVTENWNAATSELDALGTRYGIDQASNKMALDAKRGAQVLAGGQQYASGVQQIAAKIASDAERTYITEEDLKAAQSQAEKAGVSTESISPAKAATMTPKQIGETILNVNQPPAEGAPKPEENKYPLPSYQNKPPVTTPPPATEDKFSSVRSVLGEAWQPAKTFSDKGLVDKGIYGAVRVKGSPTVYTIGPGGMKIENPEQYKNLFGTLDQNNIVGEIDAEQAKKLGIKV